MFALQDYRTVLALFEDRHFGRASQRLNVTQSALSVRLKRIEAQLGARLFERGRSGATPTAAGLAFAEGARRVLEAAEEAAGAALNASQGFGETLRVGMSQVSAYQVVAPALRAFRRAQPRAQLLLVESVTATLEDQLEQRAVDVAFIHPPLHSSALSERPLTARPLIRFNAAGDGDAPLVGFPRSEAPVLMGRLRRDEDREGRAAQAEANTMLGAILLSAAGYGDCVVTRDFPNAHVTEAIASGSARAQGSMRTSVAWRARDDRAIVRAFIDAVAALDYDNAQEGIS